jgi:hypothetical protein
MRPPAAASLQRGRSRFGGGVPMASRPTWNSCRIATWPMEQASGLGAPGAGNKPICVERCWAAMIIASATPGNSL